MWSTSQTQSPVMISLSPILVFLTMYATSTHARTAQDCMIYKHSPQSQMTSMTTPSFEETIQMGFRLLPDVDKTVWNATATITSLNTRRSCEVEFNYNTSKNSYKIIVITRCDGKEVKEEKWYTEYLIDGDHWTKLFFSVSSALGSTRELYVSAQAEKSPEEFDAKADYLTGPYMFKWSTRSLMEFYLNCPNYCPIDDVKLKMAEKKTAFYITRSEYFTKVKITCDFGMDTKEMVLGKDIIPDDGLWHQVLITEGLFKLQLRMDGEIVREYETTPKKPEIKKMGVNLIGGGLLTWCDRSAFTTPVDTKGATIAASILGIIAVLSFLILLHTCHRIRRLKKKGKLDMVKNHNISSQPLQLEDEENNRQTFLSNYKQVSHYNDRNFGNHHSFEDDTEDQRYSFTSQSADQDFSLTSPSTEHYSTGYSCDGDIKQCAMRGQP